MNFEPKLFPFLFGLLFGALSGVFVAEHSRSQIWGGFRQLVERKWPLVFGIIVITLSFYFFFLDWGNNILVGGVIGFAAAPWLWLHFSRDFLPSSESMDVETTKALRQEYFSRYQLLTIMLGVTLLFLFIGPQVIKMFKSASSVNIFGLSVSMPQQASGSLTGTPMLSPASPSADRSALEKLTQNTNLAASIYDDEKIPNNGEKSNIEVASTHLKILGKLSMWNRDQIIASYFSHAAKMQRLSFISINPLRLTPELPENLSDYVKKSGIKSLEEAPDRYFLQQLADLFICLDVYAQELRDPKLFLLQVRKFLEDFSVVIQNSIRAIGDSNWTSVYKHDHAFQGLPSDTEDLVTKIKEEINKLIHQKPIDKRCTIDNLTRLEKKLKMYVEGNWIRPNSDTPYPTLLAAYAFAAVDAPETGILYISDWLEKQRKSEEHFDRRWYAYRARSELKALATQYLRLKISTQHLLAYQRDMTDDLAKLLNIKSESGWKELCMLSNRNKLHSQIGRYLAFYYATARSQVFELQTTSQLRAEYDLRGKSARILAQLEKDIAEAKRFASSGDCFTGVPLYDGNDAEGEDLPSKWLGQFELNVIQLELAHMALLGKTVSETEAEQKRKELERDLYRASSKLGPINIFRNTDRAVDTLLKTDGFEDQRERINSLLPILRKSE